MDFLDKKWQPDHSIVYVSYKKMNDLFKAGVKSF